MTQPDNPNDFASPNSQLNPKVSSSGSKALPAMLITSGVGRVCLGLVIYLGIIAAVALPNFFARVRTIRQAEAKTYMREMVQAQQAHRLGNEFFSQSASEIGVSLPPNSPNYKYQILKQGNLKQSVFMTAQPLKSNLKSYVGVVYVIKEKNQDTILTEVCESLNPQVQPPSLPTLSKNKATIECAAGSQVLH